MPVSPHRLNLACQGRLLQLKACGTGEGHFIPAAEACCNEHRTMAGTPRFPGGAAAPCRQLSPSTGCAARTCPRRVKGGDGRLCWVRGDAVVGHRGGRAAGGGRSNRDAASRVLAAQRNAVSSGWTHLNGCQFHMQGGVPPKHLPLLAHDEAASNATLGKLGRQRSNSHGCWMCNEHVRRLACRGQSRRCR